MTGGHGEGLPAPAPTDATRILRAGVLDGVTLLLAGAGGGAKPGEAATTSAVRAACAGLGAHVLELAMLADGSRVQLEEAEIEAALDRVGAPAAVIDTAVIDAASLYASAAAGAQAQEARAALSDCLESTWKVTRAVANRAFLSPARPGRIVLIAPAPGAGGHARAAAAGLENLARTLSTEWARHFVSSVAIAPGDATSADELATVAAYLASPAGAYFSGCLLDLGGPARGSADTAARALSRSSPRTARP